MPALTRPDGVEIHWEERGEGPAIVHGPAWAAHPAVFTALHDDLSTDHRVITYDVRGTGASTRTGPYDVETDAADLEAIVEEAVGGEVVLLGAANAANRAVRLAAQRPDLVAAVVSFAGPPLNRAAFAGSEGMIASEPVVEAFLEMLERDYRGALRSLMTAANPQMSEDELRERVRFQDEYAPREVTLARVRAWDTDQPLDAARAIGERLWITATPDVAGPWFPPREKMLPIVRDLLPEARIVELEDGALSRPDLSAAAIRRAVRESAGTAAERK